MGLILSTLFCYFVQNNPGTCAQIETFDHSKHGNGYALPASLGGNVADSFGFTSEPDCQFGMFGKIAFVQQNIGHALPMGGRDNRDEVVFFQMCEALFRAVKALDECPFDGGNR